MGTKSQKDLYGPGKWLSSSDFKMEKTCVGYHVADSNHGSTPSSSMFLLFSAPLLRRPCTNFLLPCTCLRKIGKCRQYYYDLLLQVHTKPGIVILASSSQLLFILKLSISLLCLSSFPTLGVWTNSHGWRWNLAHKALGISQIILSQVSAGAKGLYAWVLEEYNPWLDAITFGLRTTYH